MVRQLLAVLVLGLLTAACGNGAPSSGGQSSSAAATADGVAAFREARDEICIVGSDDVAALNARIDAAASNADKAGLLRDVVARIDEAQGDLDDVTVPGAVAAFVVADADRRAERIGLMNQLADAVEVNGFDTADAVEIDRVLNEVNVRTEAEEDAIGLAHCP